MFVARNAAAITDNFGHFWMVRDAQPIEPGAGFLRSLVPTVSAATGAFGLFVAFGVAQSGIAVFGRCLEQHWIYSGGSEESEAGCCVVDGFRHVDCYHLVLPGQRCIFVRAAFFADSECA